MKKCYTSILMTIILVASFILGGCSGNKIVSTGTSNYSIDGPYTIGATVQQNENEFYYLGFQHIDGMDAEEIYSIDASGSTIDIHLYSRNNITVCEIDDSSGHHSYYSDGNLIAEGNINALQGDTIFASLKNLLAKIVYEEKMTGESGPFTHAISNLDNTARDMMIYTDENNAISKMTTTYPFSGYNFNITYLPNPETPQININESEKIEKTDLVDRINKLADYMFATIVTRHVTQSPVIDEPAPQQDTPAVAPEQEEEPQTLIRTSEIITLPEPKDLFVKIDFSNSVSDVEFIAPTGGSYKVSSGNVEFMQDDPSSKTAYYKIPMAEMGTWVLKYDESVNQIEYKVMTDNPIKINGIQLSDIKDGIMVVSPILGIPKGLDLNYEYHVDILKDNITVSHSTNILNTKKDKANYSISVMDLEPGIYKIRLRLEYQYNDNYYVNIFSSEEFAKE